MHVTTPPEPDQVLVIKHSLSMNIGFGGRYGDKIVLA